MRHSRRVDQEKTQPPVRNAMVESYILDGRVKCGHDRLREAV